jgi:hypothetical protein
MAIMVNIDKDSRSIDERMKVPIMILRAGTPISDISGRDLPSPCDIKGDNNMLLLPYYQEIEKKESEENLKGLPGARKLNGSSKGHIRS